MIDQVSRARAIATFAHADQTDKVGKSYIDHPAGVARRLADDSEIAQAAAWLHDVMEDCGISSDELAGYGVAPDVIEVVEILTRDDRISPDEHYAAIKNHPVARRVKLADIADNTDPERTKLLDPATCETLRQKYRHALECLDATDGALYRQLADE